MGEQWESLAKALPAMQVETTGGKHQRAPDPAAAPAAGGAVARLGAAAGDRCQRLRAPASLKYGAADARKLEVALQALGRPDQLYRGADVTFITDADATQARTQRALDEFMTNLRPGDTLLPALSGHGVK